jgi:hypothetical protein
MCREKWKAQRFAMECKIRGLGCVINDARLGGVMRAYLFSCLSTLKMRHADRASVVKPDPIKLILAISVK